MKQGFVWILLGAMLIGLLGISSIAISEEGKWTKKADMPTARLWLSTSAVNGKIYAVGGSSGAALSTVEEYNPGIDLGVEAKGKLVTSCGKIKYSY